MSFYPACKSFDAGFMFQQILYDDTVECSVKTELLIDLEEYGHFSLTSER